MRTLVAYLFAFCALAVGATFALPQCFGRASATDAGHDRPASAAPPVIAAVAELAPFADTLEALGTVLANESVELTPARADHVTAIHFDDGDEVTAGQLLLELNAHEERARLAEAVSLRDDRQLNSESATELFGSDMISQRELDSARTELAAAEARVATLEAAIADRELRAPFDGVLGFRGVSLGAFVQSSTIVTTLDDISVVKLDFTIPETWLARVRPNMVIDATSAAWPDAVFAGRVTNVGSRLDASSRSATIRAVLENPKLRLRPGMLLQVAVQRGDAPTLQIPEESIIPVGTDTFALQIDDDEIAHRIKVTIGRRRPGTVEVLDGLSAGDRVVTEGIVRVRSGQPVRVIRTRTP